jgi:hypothetical protein
MRPVAEYRCRFCWAEFDDPIDLLHHEAREDDRLYDLDDGYEPSTKADTQ